MNWANCSRGSRERSLVATDSPVESSNVRCAETAAASGIVDGDAGVFSSGHADINPVRLCPWHCSTPEIGTEDFVDQRTVQARGTGIIRLNIGAPDAELTGPVRRNIKGAERRQRVGNLGPCLASQLNRHRLPFRPSENNLSGVRELSVVPDEDPRSVGLPAYLSGNKLRENEPASQARRNRHNEDHEHHEKATTHGGESSTDPGEGQGCSARFGCPSSASRPARIAVPESAWVASVPRASGQPPIAVPESAWVASVPRAKRFSLLREQRMLCGRPPADLNRLRSQEAPD